ncbi:hypothetical protein LK07_14985 [Streptomyces pluripotens]|uniref:Lipoprotein n=1 Tax=Streptomyces pluripotens TaxID=1355015 RepID=A0A221NYP5_9ACTN|nr:MULTISPECIES: hypothetical protein [Streptomyces]ARP70863.1 hypothetical protein LK06_013845 [Streptomyces pluripotens]ASN25119.1 hypothetical protein LK07_14985 [Streptomyces pluripotens]KIE25542.1 membrane protein [Streptomyces sp. MUSC 125]
MATGLLAGALALTACSGGGSADRSSTTPSADTTPASTSAPTPATGSPTVSGESATLQGSWVTASGDKVVALVITGQDAGAFATGGTVCSGTVGTEAGAPTIHLTCTGGSKDRASGRVESVSEKVLKVTWSGKLGQETYTKVEGGKLPSGLPNPLKG